MAIRNMDKITFDGDQVKFPASAILQEDLEGDISELKEDLNATNEAALNLTDRVALPWKDAGTGYINSSGNVGNSDTYDHTDYIPFGVFDTLEFKIGGTTESTTVAYCVVYNSQKQYVRKMRWKYNQSAIGYVADLASITKDTTADETYIRCTIYANTTTYGTFAVYGVGTALSKKIAAIDSEIDGLQADTTIADKKINLTERIPIPFTLINGYYIGSSGSGSASEYYNATDYVPFGDYKTIYYKRGKRNKSSSQYVAIYDSTKTFVRSIRWVSNESADGYMSSLYTIVRNDEDDEKYIRFTTWADTTSYGAFEVYGSDYPLLAKASEIDAIVGNVKEYYLAEVADTVAKVRDETTAPALVFAWTTDNHRYSSNADGVQNFGDMIKNIKRVSKSIPFDFVLDTGDLTDGSTQETTLGRAYEILEDFMSVGVPYVFVMGNHDTNYFSGTDYEYRFTLPECYKAYMTATKNTAFNADENGTDYYIDFDALGVRVVVLNADNIEQQNRAYAYGATTGSWLADVLDTDKKVLLMVHQTPYTSQIPGNAATKNSASVISTMESFVEGGGDLIMISGHSHVDMAFINPFLTVMEDCQRFSDTEGGAITADEDTTGCTGYIDCKVKNARTAGTYTEDLWTVCVYKPDNNELSLIRFGAGTDRYFHATPIAPATVTSKLSGTLTWSSSDTSVATVSDGAITGVATGRCAILAKDTSGNYECWIIDVT